MPLDYCHIEAFIIIMHTYEFQRTQNLIKRFIKCGCPTASTLWPLRTGVKLQLCLKRSSKVQSPENFLTTGGYFKHNSYHIMVLGRLKKKKKKEGKKERR